MNNISIKKRKTELLAPAGNMEKLNTAVYFGADAVYFSGVNYGLRSFAGNFNDDEIKKAVEILHSNGKKAYVTLNIFAKNSDFDNLDNYLSIIKDSNADAIIVSDPGLIEYTLKKGFKVHISTQANTLNKYAAKFWSDLGAERIVLAREISLNEIKEIRDFLPDNVELEAFVHGAMCISYSGRCLLSNYLSERDSNRGECVQACRWEYALNEINRPNESLTIQEDKRGTYILNSKDLNMIKYIDKMVDAGITSFKIEGRMKSPYYVASVVNAYNRAFDYYYQNSNNYCLPEEIEKELEKNGHRTYTTGFYLQDTMRQCLETSKPLQTYSYTANVLDYADGYALIEQRNRFKSGDVLEILSPNEYYNCKIKVSEMKNIKGENIDDARLVQEKIYLKTDIHLNKGDILRKKIN